MTSHGSYGGNGGDRRSLAGQRTTATMGGTTAELAATDNGNKVSSTPSSSAQTSDRMTPESDSEGEGEDEYDDSYHDDGYGAFGGYSGVHGGKEVYEMQETRNVSRGRQSQRVWDDNVPPGDKGSYPASSSSQSSSGRGRKWDRETSGYDHDNYDSEDEESRSRGRTPRRRREASVISTASSFQLYTPDEEKAVVRKFDRRLVVFVALLYMLSFLDRSNIGNARIAGMDDDLQSDPPRSNWYEWALSAFYIAYIAFEWMSLLWRLIPAHIYVTLIVLSWGLTASLQAVAVNYPMLIFLRTVLGIGEAAFTGVPFYLSFFFKRHELAFRTAIFISAAPLATSFASSLAWLVLKLGEASPIAPWRLLFLVEGFPSVLVAAIAWNVIPDSPQTAPYLTAREKKVARLRLRREKQQQQTSTKKVVGTAAVAVGKPTNQDTKTNNLNARDVLAVFSDPVAWLTSAIFFLTNMAYSSLPVFLPTILTAMGHSALSAQALSAPPYLAAFIFVLATARASDGMRARAPLLITHALASAGGYAVLALFTNPDPKSFFHLAPGSTVRYLAVYPAAIGFFNVVVLTIAWSINNQRNESRQGGGFALLQVVGQCGPLVGTRLYPDADAPYYARGMGVCALAMAGVAVLAVVLRWYMARANRLMDEGEGREVGGGEDVGGAIGEEEEALVGEPGKGGRRRRRRNRERAIPFRYML